MSINHIAIIMDGNRRWAKANSLSLKEAYKNGVQNLYKTIENSNPFLKEEKSFHVEAGSFIIVKVAF